MPPTPARAPEAATSLSLPDAAIGLLAGLAGFTAVILGGQLLHAVLIGSSPTPISPGALLLQAAAHLGGAAAAVAAVWARHPGTDPARLAGARASPGLGPVWPVVLALGVLAGLALQLPLAELGNVVAQRFPLTPEHQAFLHRLSTPGTAGEAAATVLAIVLVAPLAEEVVFRGLLALGLRQTIGPIGSLLVSSAAFAAVHGHPTAMAYAGAAGLVLGLLAHASGGIALGVSVHAGVNALPLLLPSTLVEIPGLNTLELGRPHLPLPWVTGGAVVSAVGLVAALRLASRRRAASPGSPPTPQDERPAESTTTTSPSR